MKTILLVKTLMLVVATATYSLPAFAQQSSEQKEVLKGKWVLESVSASDVNDVNPIDVNSLKVEVFSEIEIDTNTITIVYKGKTLKGEYSIDNMNINFDFSSLPFDAEWGITGDKLYLLQKIKSPLSETEILISSIYKRK